MSDPSFADLAPNVSDLRRRYEAAYDAARDRAIWNKRLASTRAPDAIVRASTSHEVAAAIRFAGRHGFKVSPRGSGHHYDAAALRDGGLLLDLSELDFIEIDQSAGMARVGAGVVGGTLSERLAADGFAFPVGHCADVGLSGYILAGGFGWNGREWGAACGNVEAIEMVTANGEMVTASATEHADLFWAARGGGPGFFAAVTAYHLRLHRLPATTLTWRGSFAVNDAPALADWLTAAIAAAHPAVEVGCFLMSHWDTNAPSVILRVSVCADSEDEARDRIGSFGSPPVEVAKLGEIASEVRPFTELFGMSAMPSGKRVAADHLWSDAPLGELLMAIHELRAPSPDATVDLVAFGGHSRVPLPADAALAIGGGTGIGIYALWDDAADDAANRAWVRRVDAALAPLRTGRYVGEADLTLGPDRLAECFTTEALARLAQLRQRHDPDGLFFQWP